MDIAEKVYSIIKTSVDKNGFPPSIREIADELKIPNREALSAVEQLKESGRIKNADISRKTTKEFAD